MNNKIVERIRSGGFSRQELLTLRDNAQTKIAQGNHDGVAIITALNSTELPKLQSEYVFMGFCPGASLYNRQDERWLSEGICKFDWIDSKVQLKRFLKIMPGDAIIMKKREKFGETMKLFHHGIVTALDDLPSGGRVLSVDWHSPPEPLVVPLLGCNGTVDVRDLGSLKDMPNEFWAWLDLPHRAA